MAHPLPETTTRELERRLRLDWQQNRSLLTKRAALFISLGRYGLRIG